MDRQQQIEDMRKEARAFVKSFGQDKSQKVETPPKPKSLWETAWFGGLIATAVFTTAWIAADIDHAAQAAAKPPAVVATALEQIPADQIHHLRMVPAEDSPAPYQALNSRLWLMRDGFVVVLPAAETGTAEPI